jgi:hypothetical protein
MHCTWPMSQNSLAPICMAVPLFSNPVHRSGGRSTWFLTAVRLMSMGDCSFPLAHSLYSESNEAQFSGLVSPEYPQFRSCMFDGSSCKSCFLAMERSSSARGPPFPPFNMKTVQHTARAMHAPAAADHLALSMLVDLRLLRCTASNGCITKLQAETNQPPWQEDPAVTRLKRPPM